MYGRTGGPAAAARWKGVGRNLTINRDDRRTATNASNGSSSRSGSAYVFEGRHAICSVANRGSFSVESKLYQLLTPMELRVLRLIADGYRPSEIARALDRSVSTVNNHLHNARSKLQLSDSLTAARKVVAFESSRQSMPRHDLPIADGVDPRLPVIAQHPDAAASEMPREAQVSSEPGILATREVPETAVGGLGGGASNVLWRRLAAILCLALLLVASISLAPAMAETFQLIIDLIYPLIP